MIDLLEKFAMELLNKRLVI